MNRKIFIVIAVFLLIACVGIAAVQTGKVPPGVWWTAKAEGVVRLIVELKVPWQPEGNLRQEVILTQRHAIAVAQDELLAELTGTKHKVTQRIRAVPSLGLEVGIDAISVLERSRLVVSLEEDQPMRLQ